VIQREIDAMLYVDHCEDVGAATYSCEILCCYSWILGCFSSDFKQLMFPRQCNFKATLLIAIILIRCYLFISHTASFIYGLVWYINNGSL
jgi:hypothetical protein